MNLVMTIPIKNHAVYLRPNIEYHIAQGIDAFVILMHNSTDESEEILQDMQRKYPITYIKQDSGVFADSEFRMRMVNEGIKRYSATWVINNDIDEFWVPQMGSKKVKDILIELSDQYNTIYCERYNFIPFVEAGDVYKSPPASFKYRVCNPVKLDKTLPFDKITPLDFTIKTNAGKAACATKGLIQIGPGSHEIVNEPHDVTISKEIVIMHYPYSTLEVFLQETENKVRSVLSDKSLLPNQNWHVKLLQYLVQNHHLEKFAEGLFPDNYTINKLLKIGIIKEDLSVYNFFKL